MPDNSFAKLKKLSSDVAGLFDEEQAALHGEKRMSAGRQFVLFWLMVVKSFVRNRCPVRASALAYTTLLALIPLLAVGLGISVNLLQSEGMAPIEQLVDKLVGQVAPQLGLIPGDEAGQAAREEVVIKITDFIANIHSGALGLSGTIGLIATAILLLSNIEATFNDIWGVGRGRNWFARVIQYWAAITLGPLLAVLAIGLTVGGKFETLQNRLNVVPMLGDFVFVFAPLFVLILAFTLFYQLMPNTKVHWQAALVGATVGGILWNVNSQFNVLFASKVITASRIYGPLSAVPVVLIGLYFSWLIMLFGAQVAYAFQNRRTYLQERQADAVNQRGREFVALRVMVQIALRFRAGAPPPTAAELAEALDVPTRLVMQVLKSLVLAHLAIESSSPREPGYVPGRPLEQISARDILHALRSTGGQELPTADDAQRSRVRSEFERIFTVEARASAAVNLADLTVPAEEPPKEEDQGGSRS
jgi:membrane protein